MPFVLHIFIYEGKDIKMRKRELFPDTCISLYLGSTLNIQKTKTISKTTNPTYNSYHKFIIPSKTLPNLTIRAIKYSLFSVQCIAKTEICLSCLNIGPVIENWFPLEHVCNESIHPQIRMKLQIIPQGFPMFKPFSGPLPVEDLPPLQSDVYKKHESNKALTDEEKKAYGEYVEVDDSFSESGIWDKDYEYVEDYDSSLSLDEDEDENELQKQKEVKDNKEQNQIIQRNIENDLQIKKKKREKKLFRVQNIPLEKWESLKFVPVEEIGDDNESSSEILNEDIFVIK